MKTMGTECTRLGPSLVIRSLAVAKLPWAAVQKSLCKLFDAQALEELDVPNRRKVYHWGRALALGVVEVCEDCIWRQGPM